MAQACVLGRLTRQVGMRELADELGCDASNITRIIRRLEARDLVRRRPHPDDRRSRQIVRPPAEPASTPPSSSPSSSPGPPPPT
ncbi:MarR family transcriptional regulator [Nonomuraea sp. NPDC005692]|uniref:MarR family transcriptional regulator n=1 Tax=Nonomuraea sp. NPDC005692 TaxID=3157168 RepID=UPI0033E1FA1F